MDLSRFLCGVCNVEKFPFESFFQDFIVCRLCIENCISIKIDTYKYDVILWIVGISSTYIESVSLQWLQNADMIPTIKEL